MHPELMFVPDVKVLYNSTLSDENSLVSLKIQVLKNLQTYLQEEDNRMQEADRECECDKKISCVMALGVLLNVQCCYTDVRTKRGLRDVNSKYQHANHTQHSPYDEIYVFVNLGKKQAKQEDLKEMGDISSGMSSSIMQIYLKQVLESFFHSQSTVRHFALSVITLTLSQGLIHPVQVSSHSYCTALMRLAQYSNTNIVYMFL